MTKIEQDLWAAFDRIKTTKKPSRANIAIEAGKNPSTIKPDRYPELCKAIEESAAKWESRGKSRDEMTAQKLKADKTELEQTLMKAYNRELLLIKKIRELELELATKKGKAVETLSANMVDFTKLDQ